MDYRLLISSLLLAGSPENRMNHPHCGPTHNNFTVQFVGGCCSEQLDISRSTIINFDQHLPACSSWTELQITSMQWILSCRTNQSKCHNYPPLDSLQFTLLLCPQCQWHLIARHSIHLCSCSSCNHRGVLLWIQYATRETWLRTHYQQWNIWWSRK